MPLVKKKTMDDYLKLMPDLDHTMKFRIGPELVEFLQNERNHIDPSHIKPLIDNTLPWLQTTSARVIENGLNILITLASRVGLNFRPYLPTVIPMIINKLSDNKEYVRDKCKGFLKNLVQKNIVSANYMVEQLIPALNIQKSNIREEAMKMLIIIIKSFRKQKLNLKPVIPYLLKLMNEVNPAIRELAIKTLIEMYKHAWIHNYELKSEISKSFVGPKHKLDNLFRIFDEIPILEILAVSPRTSSIDFVKTNMVSCKTIEETPPDPSSSTSALQKQASQHSSKTLRPSHHSLNELTASQQTVVHPENITEMSISQNRIRSYADMMKKISRHDKDLSRMKASLATLIRELRVVAINNTQRDMAKYEEETLKQDDDIIDISEEEVLEEDDWKDISEEKVLEDDRKEMKDISEEEVLEEDDWKDIFEEEVLEDDRKEMKDISEEEVLEEDDWKDISEEKVLEDDWKEIKDISEVEVLEDNDRKEIKDISEEKVLEENYRKEIKDISEEEVLEEDDRKEIKDISEEGVLKEEDKKKIIKCVFEKETPFETKTYKIKILESCQEGFLEESGEVGITEEELKRKLERHLISEISLFGSRKKLKEIGVTKSDIKKTKMIVEDIDLGVAFLCKEKPTEEIPVHLRYHYHEQVPVKYIRKYSMGKSKEEKRGDQPKQDD